MRSKQKKIKLIQLKNKNHKKKSKNQVLSWEKVKVKTNNKKNLLSNSPKIKTQYYRNQNLKIKKKVN